MKHLIFAVGIFLFLASSAAAAENSYPPPPPAGKALSVEDTIYGVLRNHHNLRGMIENREVLTHEVRRAEGPERIAGEWWRQEAPTRDYFRVEDAEGRRFWMFREGLYGVEAAHPRWFVHGLFA